jgi:hypothetical protein
MSGRDPFFHRRKFYFPPLKIRGGEEGLHLFLYHNSPRPSYIKRGRVNRKTILGNPSNS